MKLTLIEKRNETDNVKTFVFKSGTPLKWIAGQYLIYSLEHKNKDLRGKMRFFTISSAPFEKYPTITTRIFEKPSTFKKNLNNLKIGAKIEAKGPDGDFIIEDYSKNFVFIAGGIGITPFISILRQLDHDNKKVRITLLYSNKNKNVIFKKDLEKLKERNSELKINYIFSPDRIDKKLLNNFVNKNIIFYVSGPDPMVEEIEKTLTTLGIDKEYIKSDYFSGYKS